MSGNGRILERAVNNYQGCGNREPEEEEKQLNDTMGESQLTGLQYKLTQGKGKLSNGRTKMVIEKK